MGSAADASPAWSETSARVASPALDRHARLLRGDDHRSVVALSPAEELLAWDVRFAYLPAAEAILDGDSPYPALDDPILEEQKGYVYPPQLLLALVPLTPLPVGVGRRSSPARRCWLCSGSRSGSRVRDVRCYAASLLWMPAVSGVLLGNISIPLAFALAVAWRYRDACGRRPGPSASPSRRSS